MSDLGINQFFSTPAVQIPILAFIINLILTALFSLILQRIYERYGNSLSNRSDFGENFLLVSMTTMLIITIVKSSLALSLGLVGALSIIRFRAAIKEPEELAYLFLTISIGLGFGANQTKITILAFLIISVIIIIKHSIHSDTKNSSNSNLILIINSSDSEKFRVNELIELLKENCKMVMLKRMEENSNSIEVCFQIEPHSYENLLNLRTSLMKLKNINKLNFLDNNY